MYPQDCLTALVAETDGRIRDGAGTRVAFNWYVRVTNPALNLPGYIAGRAYRHSHDGVMREGESGLRDYCRRITPAVTDDPPS